MYVFDVTDNSFFSATYMPVVHYETPIRLSHNPFCYVWFRCSSFKLLALLRWQVGLLLLYRKLTT